MKTLRWIQAAIIVMAICPCAIGAEETSQQGIFSGSLADSLWAVIAFTILVIILGKLAWKPLLAGLKAREDRIREEIMTAENARKQAEKTLAEYNSRVEQLEQQGRQITEKAAKEAEKLGREIAEKARQESLELKQKAQSDIESAHAAAKERLWDETGDIVLAISSRVLGRTITDDDNQRLVRDAVEKLKSSHASQGETA